MMSAIDPYCWSHTAWMSSHHAPHALIGGIDTLAGNMHVRQEKNNY